jgi:hypothetical protein
MAPRTENFELHPEIDELIRKVRPNTEVNPYADIEAELNHARFINQANQEAHCG